MPRLLLATVAALALAAPAQAITFNYTGSIVTWTVPADGTYSIEAIGAAGGAGTTPIGFQSMGANGPITYDTQVMGGRGALIGAQFELTSGTVLQIAVGGMGNSGTGLFAPGGGGGGVHGMALRNGWDASTGQNGVSGSTFNPADVGMIGGGDPFLPNFGQGGPRADSVNQGAGGGGFNSNGEDLTSGGGGGGSWFNLLAGGSGCATPTGVAAGGAGGFGGGGGAGDACTGAGGGGGFSGGQGGAAAGGGGSFWNSFLSNGTRWFEGAAGTGSGLVTITQLGAEEEVTTPEPASATIALLGLFGLAAIRRRR
jgi:MYXO-CTERM domain-containing protein